MAATDRFASKYDPESGGVDWSADTAAAVTPSDTVDLTTVCRGLYVGVSGDVKVNMARSGTVTFKAAPVGVLPIRVTRVYATGTTATNILALE